MSETSGLSSSSPPCPSLLSSVAPCRGSTQSTTLLSLTPATSGRLGAAEKWGSQGWNELPNPLKLGVWCFGAALCKELC